MQILESIYLLKKLEKVFNYSTLRQIRPREPKSSRSYCIHEELLLSPLPPVIAAGEFLMRLARTLQRQLAESCDKL